MRIASEQDGHMLLEAAVKAKDLSLVACVAEIMGNRVSTPRVGDYPSGPEAMGSMAARGPSEWSCSIVPRFEIYSIGTSEGS